MLTDSRLDPLDGLFLSHHPEYVKDAGAYSAASQGHAHRLGKLSELDTLFCHEGIKYLFYFRVNEGFNGFQASCQVREKGRDVGRQMFRLRLLVHRDLVHEKRNGRGLHLDERMA